MAFPPSGPPVPRGPRPPAEIARWGWIAFGLSLVAPAVALLGAAGLSLGPVSFLAVPALIAGVVLGILALRHGARPRWPAVTALVFAGLYAVAFISIGIWAVIGLVQIMFAPTF